MALIPAPVVEDGKPPISGVKLGPLLGKGSFGSVHYGTWNGAQVAIKVPLSFLLRRRACQAFTPLQPW